MAFPYIGHLGTYIALKGSRSVPSWLRSSQQLGYMGSLPPAMPLRAGSRRPAEGSDLEPAEQHVAIFKLIWD